MMSSTLNKLNEALNFHQNGELDKAGRIYELLLNENPDEPNLLYYYGLLSAQIQDFDKTIMLLSKINEGEIEDNLLLDTKVVLGEIYIKQNNIEFAKKYFTEVLTISPSNLIANFNMGNISLKNNECTKAISYYTRALRAEESQVEIYRCLVEAYKQNEDITGVINSYLKLIKLESKNEINYFNVAYYYKRINDTPSAYKAYSNAIYLKPDFVDAHINIADIFNMCNDFKQAESHLLKAFDIDNNRLEIYHALSNVYIDSGEIDKLFSICEEGLKKFSNAPQLLANKAKGYLLIGNTNEGWEYFKLRRRINELKNLGTYLLDYNGSLQNKKILVYSDSGFGDSIQFIRYVHLLKDLGAKVYLSIQPSLNELVKQSNFNVEIVEPNQKLDELDYDFHINITSLAYLFKKDVNNFPYKENYLIVSEDKVRAFKEKYINENCFNIGIVWHSHFNLFRKNIDNLNEFYHIAKIPGVKLYSLQQTNDKPMFDNLNEDFKIIHVGDTFEDFTDTAAAVKNMDLLITIDTAVAHLAGAIGKPVWTMLPKVPNWRWSMEGNISPWYETMRLFRQKEENNWASVIQEIKTELESLLSIDKNA